ncbi:hypothetical protein ElyMa_005125200 [Elysia marginata]|uniref:Endonuclease/exonuclease/phosphatase domain-containing protein n=1 Tax=Elysia marginata TaxID=1093978 RepID=A0AAV4JMX3_9GAST|nr:hypothetical protein ElyMa_005125200 [Elysia marginata]
MLFRNKDYSRFGASTVDHQADEVPSSLPRNSPPQATGGNNNEKNKTLTILHWNAEGISRNKLALANRLKKEDIDVAYPRIKFNTTSQTWTQIQYERIPNL